MHFALTDEQALIQETARRYAETALAPVAAALAAPNRARSTSPA